MKVLHLSTARSWRGGEQQLAYLAGELQAERIPQGICCLSGVPLAMAAKEVSIPVHLFESRGLLDLSLARLVRSLCRREGYTLVHAHDSHAHSAAVLSSSLYGNKAALVVSRRVDFGVSKHPFSRWKYNYAGIRKMICVSEKIRSILLQTVADAEKTCVIYDGIDLARFVPGYQSPLRSELGIETKYRIVGNASALADHKDYITFVDAAEIILKRKPDTRFVIIGEGPDRKNIEDRIAFKKLRPYFFLTSFRNQVERLLPGFDIFLMTSSTEGLGSILLDAFASGVPVVATDAGGIPEIVTADTGLIAPVKDAAALAGHVCTLLDDPVLAHKLRQQALEFVKGFSKEKMARQTLEVYQQVEKR